MKQVLIVDDNILDNKAVRMALSGQFFTSSVTSGTDVFAYLGSHRPDMILLDQYMPDMTGFDVIKKLKANEDFADIPVMFLTGTRRVRWIRTASGWARWTAYTSPQAASFSCAD
jgi:putative two-component system response regulator